MLFMVTRIYDPIDGVFGVGRGFLKFFAVSDVIQVVAGVIRPDMVFASLDLVLLHSDLVFSCPTYRILISGML
jgi:hypothetical protein